MVNNYKLNQRKEGIEWADKILFFSYSEEVPLRYLDMARIMKADMENWDEGLDEISREMRIARDRIKNRKAGAETQRVQKEILAKLDKHIKDLEKQQADAQAQAEQEGKPKTEQAQNPPQDTPNPQLPPTSGQVDHRKVKELAQVWGKLPEKERTRALVELTRSLPPKDKAVVEKYFKELQLKAKRH